MQAFKKCVLRTITDLIRITTNIRHGCIITHQSNIETLLDAIEWVALLDICQKIGENNFERKQTGIKRDGIDAENSSN